MDNLGADMNFPGSDMEHLTFPPDIDPSCSTNSLLSGLSADPGYSTANHGTDNTALFSQSGLDLTDYPGAISSHISGLPVLDNDPITDSLDILSHQLPRTSSLPVLQPQNLGLQGMPLMNPLLANIHNAQLQRQGGLLGNTILGDTDNIIGGAHLTQQQLPSIGTMIGTETVQTRATLETNASLPSISVNLQPQIPTQLANISLKPQLNTMSGGLAFKGALSNDFNNITLKVPVSTVLNVPVSTVLNVNNQPIQLQLIAKPLRTPMHQQQLNINPPVANRTLPLHSQHDTRIPPAPIQVTSGSDLSIPKDKGVMLFRDKMTGKSFLVPSGPPMHNNTSQDFVTSANAINNQLPELPYETKCLPELVNVSEFLNIPPKSTVIDTSGLQTSSHHSITYSNIYTKTDPFKQEDNNIYPKHEDITPHISPISHLTYTNGNTPVPSVDKSRNIDLKFEPISDDEDDGGKNSDAEILKFEPITDDEDITPKINHASNIFTSPSTHTVLNHSTISHAHAPPGLNTLSDGHIIKSINQTQTLDSHVTGILNQSSLNIPVVGIPSRPTQQSVSLSVPTTNEHVVNYINQTTSAGNDNTQNIAFQTTSSTSGHVTSILDQIVVNDEVITVKRPHRLQSPHLSGAQSTQKRGASDTDYDTVDSEDDSDTEHKTVPNITIGADGSVHKKEESSSKATVTCDNEGDSEESDTEIVEPLHKQWIEFADEEVVQAEMGVEGEETEGVKSKRVEVNVHIAESQCIRVAGVRKWKCLDCPKMYSSKHNLMTHVLGHMGLKPHSCDQCDKSFKQQSHLQAHMLIHNKVKPHQCHMCDKKFTQSSHLRRHLATHMETRPHVCDICQRGFAYPSELKTHIDKHRSGEETQCVDCGEKFNTMKALKHHKQVKHRDSTDHTCGECGQVFMFPSQLRDHVVKHTGMRPYTCTHCGMDFYKEHHLKNHLYTHSGVQPYTCPVCNRAFNQKANMQRHMLIHETEKRFRCTVCSRAFTQPQILKAHMVTHSQEKPHKCSICDKTFSRVHNLKGHMALHEGSKKYICFCGASFTLKGNLNRHRKVKHDLDGPQMEYSEEEAAKILNQMAAAKQSQPIAETDDTQSDDFTHGDDVTPAKKKRKSVPRKTMQRSESVMEDVAAAEWSQGIHQLEIEFVNKNKDGYRSSGTEEEQEDSGNHSDDPDLVHVTQPQERVARPRSRTTRARKKVKYNEENITSADSDEKQDSDWSEQTKENSSISTTNRKTSRRRTKRS